MDLWDVFRLMLRRWMVALPMLMITIAGTVWVGMTVKPDYSAEGNVSLLPPSVEQGVEAGKSRTVNPWDTSSLTGAVVIRLRSKAMHDALAAEGLAANYQADRDVQYPTVVTVKVTARTQALAQATVRRLLQLVNDEVARQQTQYNLKAGEEITTIVVDDGSNVETVTGKIKRALIVVFGIGAIFTMALTVSIDGLLRWRTRRREEQRSRLAAQAAKLPVGQPGGTAGANGATVTGATSAGGQAEETRPIGVNIQYRSAAGGAGAGKEGPAKERTGADRPAGGDTPAGAAPASAAPRGTTVRSSTARGGSARTEPEVSPEATQRIDTRLEPVADDATIILPLSNAPWASKKPQNTDNATR